MMAEYGGTNALRGPLGKGILFGGAAAVGWALARRYGQADDVRLIDWEWATRVANRVCAADGTLFTEQRPRLQREYEAMVREIEQPIADYTGTIL
ncbi:MAG: hypothetical protein H0V51_00560, partial [Chloroflexi bacterium]|nr:hypothetical protein [Chloroflexota bacterium]